MLIVFDHLKNHIYTDPFFFFIIINTAAPIPPARSNIINVIIIYVDVLLFDAGGGFVELRISGVGASAGVAGVGAGAGADTRGSLTHIL